MGSKDVDGKKMSKSMLSLCAELMKDGIVGNSKVSTQEIDQDPGTRHIDEECSVTRENGRAEDRR